MILCWQQGKGTDTNPVDLLLIGIFRSGLLAHKARIERKSAKGGAAWYRVILLLIEQGIAITVHLVDGIIGHPVSRVIESAVIDPVLGIKQPDKGVATASGGFDQNVRLLGNQQGVNRQVALVKFGFMGQFEPYTVFCTMVLPAILHPLG